MSIDLRTRRQCDFHEIERDEVFDSLLPEAVARHGELAARGLVCRQLPAIAFKVGDRTLELAERDGKLHIASAAGASGTVAELDAHSLSNLVQDRQTTMGLAMNSQVQIIQGSFDAFIGWEPILRGLIDGRRVHEAGDIELKDADGRPLDLERAFTLGDDRAEMAQFLEEAGFLHVRGVFEHDEMEAISADLDVALDAAKPDDGASWWGGDADGNEQAVRVLWFHEKSEELAKLIKDERLQWISRLTGDIHDGTRIGAEGLIKPLGIKTGLSDLPWHKDCGQGMHSYMCCGLTTGISITGADHASGALGVVPGSHRANVRTAGRDGALDLAPFKIATKKGDITMHCGDTLHRAYPPTERPRKVVYTHFPLAPLPGDVIAKPNDSDARAARANLTSVRNRIESSGGDAKT